MNDQLFQEVLDSLTVLKEDNDVSKRIKEKAEQVATILTSDEQLAIEKALLEFEEVQSLEMSSYHRTQVWDIISMLEGLKN